MQYLPRVYLTISNISARKIPYTAGIAIFVIISSIFLAFLALPAKASLESNGYTKSLDQEVVLNFTFITNKDDIKITINPPIDFEYTWSGFLVNQTLTIKPTTLLQPNEYYTVNITNVKNTFELSANNRTFSFKTEGLPKVISSYPELGSGRIKPNPTFSFTLDKNVNYGSYELVSTPSIKTNFTKTDTTIEFTPSKTLDQGKEYLIDLRFNAEGLSSTDLFGGKFLVVKPLKIVKTSPKQQVQNASKNDAITLKFNKSLKEVYLGSLIKIKPFQEVKYELVDEKTVKISAKPKFVTATEYKVVIDKKIEAKDGASLEKNYILKFKTAGPVTVVGSSPNGWGVSLASIMSVTFDQKVDKKSAEASFSSSPNLGGYFTWSGNTMTFVPNNTLALFKNYSFDLAKGIIGPGGEPSNKVFSTNFTTTSERQSRIGTSVKGRAITAYYFGVGAKKILLAGSLHGTESNTKGLLLGWVSFLRANQQLIPKDRTFIVVPSVNPDGVAAQDRFNARGVDLNRNYGTSTWQKTTYWNGGAIKNGGGSVPFSEPETKALRNLINKESPKITISYHSAAGVVISDGPSNALRNWYASKTGYTNIAGATNYDDVFSYDVTGSLEEWLGEKGKVVIVVELASAYNSEYLRNLPALKGLLKYKL